MGKRQVRIFQKDIDLNRQRLLQQDAHVVLGSGRVLRGVIIELTGRHLTLLNQRLHPQTVGLEEVEEIVYDKEAAY
jgi:hypothetical protein